MVTNALLAMLPLMLITIFFCGVVGGLEVKLLAEATRSTSSRATNPHEAFDAVRLSPHVLEPGWVFPPRKLLQNSAGQCGPNFHCQNGLCCSTNSYCGSSPAYCGEGCQSSYGTCSNSTSTSTTATPLPQGTVPIAIPGGSCGPGPGFSCGSECCSTFGYCGNDDAHCGVGCQPAYGTCNVTGTPTNTPVPKSDKGSRWSTVKTVGTVVGAFVGVLGATWGAVKLSLQWRAYRRTKAVLVNRVIVKIRRELVYPLGETGEDGKRLVVLRSVLWEIVGAWDAWHHLYNRRGAHNNFVPGLWNEVLESNEPGTDDERRDTIYVAVEEAAPLLVSAYARDVLDSWSQQAFERRRVVDAVVAGVNRRVRDMVAGRASNEVIKLSSGSHLTGDLYPL